MPDPITTTVLAKAAAGAVGRLGGEQIADRLKALVELQREEIKLLNELQRGMDRLLAAPLVEAGRLLEDANQPYRSDEDRRRLLDGARGALTRALSQDVDPLRLSAAALLLAGVWVALGYPEDAPAQVRAAHAHAVQAALALTDAIPAAPTRPRPVPIRLLVGFIPQVSWRNAAKSRPKSLRMRTVNSISVFGRKLVQPEQYAATSKALENEETLLRIDHEWVRPLRALRLHLEEPENTVSEYRVGLISSVSATMDGIGFTGLGYTASTAFYGLSYEEVQPLEAVPVPTERPSDRYPRMNVRFLPSREQLPPPT